MLATGKRINDIAEAFALSAKTIGTHKSPLMQKLCIASNSKLIRYSIRPPRPWTTNETTPNGGLIRL